MCAENTMQDKKICCPVCGKTFGFVQKPADGIIEIKCTRCKKVTRFSLYDCSAILKRLALAAS